jgi:general stress protein CsbA
MTNAKWLIALDMANVLMGNVFVPEDTQDQPASKLTALTLVALDTVFVWRGPVSAVRAGGGLRVTQWIMRLDNVCLIAQVMVISIWRPKNASVKDNGLEMTALKNVVI